MKIIRTIVLVFVLCIPALSFSKTMPGWNQPAFFSDLIENHPECHRRVYYYFDLKNGMEYNRVQFSCNRDRLNREEVKMIGDFYENLYSKTLNDIKKGERYSLSQYVAPDTVSYTVEGYQSGSLDIGPETLEVDLGQCHPAAAIAKQPDFARLIKTITPFATRKGVTETKVKYTGFKSGYLFTFHRGTGKGWTTGTRYTIKNATRADFESLREIINSFIGSKMPVTVFDRTWLVMLKNENGPQFYAVGYDPSTKVMNILIATVENEICIPALWQELDYLTD